MTNRKNIFQLYGNKLLVNIGIDAPNKTGEWKFHFEVLNDDSSFSNSDLTYLSNKIDHSSISVRKFTNIKFEITSFSFLWFENEEFEINRFINGSSMKDIHTTSKIITVEVLNMLCFKFILISILYITNYCCYIFHAEDLSIDEVAFAHNKNTKRLLEKFKILDYLFKLNIYLEGTFTFSRINFDTIKRGPIKEEVDNNIMRTIMVFIIVY